MENIVNLPISHATPPSSAPEGWQPLPENEDERAGFDTGTKMHGDVRLNIAHVLKIWAAAKPGGSYAGLCRIMANEVAKLTLPSATPSTPPPAPDGDAKDAARYRWLRDSKAYVAVQPHHEELPRGQRTGWTIRLVCGNDESMDAAIDVSMSGGGQ